MAWQEPKTTWTPGEGLADNDMNRIEGNIEYLKGQTGIGISSGTTNSIAIAEIRMILSIDHILKGNMGKFWDHFSSSFPTSYSEMTIDHAKTNGTHVINSEEFMTVASHGLSTGDFVYNSVRSGGSVITKLTDNVILADTAIGSQVIGDTISKYTSLGTATAGAGTTTTNIELTAHGMANGDYIINEDYQEIRTVTVVDANNVTVSAIAGQASGDTISSFTYVTDQQIVTPYEIVVEDGSVFTAGQEVTIQDETNKIARVIGSISTNTLTFTSTFTEEFEDLFAVYRSNIDVSTEDDYMKFAPLAMGTASGTYGTESTLYDGGYHDGNDNINSAGNSLVVHNDSIYAGYLVPGVGIKIRKENPVSGFFEDLCSMDSASIKTGPAMCYDESNGLIHVFATDDTTITYHWVFDPDTATGDLFSTKTEFTRAYTQQPSEIKCAIDSTFSYIGVYYEIIYSGNYNAEGHVFTITTPTTLVADTSKSGLWCDNTAESTRHFGIDMDGSVAVLCALTRFNNEGYIIIMRTDSSLKNNPFEALWNSSKTTSSLIHVRRHMDWEHHNGDADVLVKRAGSNIGRIFGAVSSYPTRDLVVVYSDNGGLDIQVSYGNIGGAPVLTEELNGDICIFHSRYGEVVKTKIADGEYAPSTNGYFYYVDMENEVDDSRVIPEYCFDDKILHVGAVNDGGTADASFTIGNNYQCPTKMRIPMDKPFCIELDFQLPNDISSRTTVFTFKDGDNEVGIIGRIESDGYFQVYMGSGSAVKALIKNTVVNFEDNLWHHVKYTWDGTTNTDNVTLDIDYGTEVINNTMDVIPTEMHESRFAFGTPGGENMGGDVKIKNFRLSLGVTSNSADRPTEPHTVTILGDTGYFYRFGDNTPGVVESEIIDPNAYYVSTTGNDSNPGTEASPWLTIQHAVDTVSPGDHVYIREGTYSENVAFFSSGSAGNIIVIEGYPNEEVIVDGTSSGITFNLNSQDYITVKRITVKNSTFQGIGDMSASTAGNYTLGSHDIIIDNVLADSNYASGIGFSCGQNITIKNCRVTNANTGADQEAITLFSVDGFEIDNNKLYNNNKEYIDCKVGCKNGTVHNNDCRDFSTTYGYNQGIYIDMFGYDSSNITIYNNVIEDTNGTPGGTSTGIMLGNEYASVGGDYDNIEVYGNIVVNCDFGMLVEWSNDPVGGQYDCNDLHFHDNIISGSTYYDFRSRIGTGYATSCELVNNKFDPSTNYDFSENGSGGWTISGNTSTTPADLERDILPSIVIDDGTAEFKPKGIYTANTSPVTFNTESYLDTTSYEYLSVYMTVVASYQSGRGAQGFQQVDYPYTDQTTGTGIISTFDSQGLAYVLIDNGDATASRKIGIRTDGNNTWGTRYVIGRIGYERRQMRGNKQLGKCAIMFGTKDFNLVVAKLGTQAIEVPVLEVDMRMTIDSLTAVNQVVSRLYHNIITGFSIDGKLSVVGTGQNENFAQMTVETTDLGASDRETELYLDSGTPGEKVTMKVTLTRANIGDDGKVDLILGGYDNA